MLIWHSFNSIVNSLNVSSLRKMCGTVYFLTGCGCFMLKVSSCFCQLQPVLCTHCKRKLREEKTFKTFLVSYAASKLMHKDRLNPEAIKSQWIAYTMLVLAGTVTQLHMRELILYANPAVCWRASIVPWWCHGRQMGWSAPFAVSTAARQLGRHLMGGKEGKQQAHCLVKKKKKWDD